MHLIWIIIHVIRAQPTGRRKRRPTGRPKSTQRTSCPGLKRLRDAGGNFASLRLGRCEGLLNEKRNLKQTPAQTVLASHGWSPNDIESLNAKHRAFRELIAKYEAVGFATRVPWTLRWGDWSKGWRWLTSSENSAQTDCLWRHRGVADWVSNARQDEFPMGRGRYASLSDWLWGQSKPRQAGEASGGGGLDKVHTVRFIEMQWLPKAGLAAQEAVRRLFEAASGRAVAAVLASGELERPSLPWSRMEVMRGGEGGQGVWLESHRQPFESMCRPEHFIYMDASPYCVAAREEVWVGWELEQGLFVPDWQTEASLEHMSRHMFNFSHGLYPSRRHQGADVPSNLDSETGRPLFGANYSQCTPPCSFNLPPAPALPLGFGNGWPSTFGRLMPCLANLLKDPSHACADGKARGSLHYGKERGRPRF